MICIHVSCITVDILCKQILENCLKISWKSWKNPGILLAWFLDTLIPHGSGLLDLKWQNILKGSSGQSQNQPVLLWFKIYKTEQFCSAFCDSYRSFFVL